MSHPEVDHKEGDVSTLQTGLKCVPHGSLL